MKPNEIRRQMRETAITRLKMYLKPLPSGFQPRLWGQQVRMTCTGRKITRAFTFVIMDGEMLVNANLYVANLCRYRRDKVGMVLPGEFRTLQDIISEVSEHLGFKVVEGRL